MGSPTGQGSLPASAIPETKTTTWVEPRLVCEVRYREWTPDGLLRHPAFLRMRDDKAPEDCWLPGEQKPLPELPAVTAPAAARAEITNPDKVFWPDEGLTKGDLIAYYRAADVMFVTPLRDGMNLVAKEFVASRPDDDGVLVLSQHAGASAELRAALLVDPTDVDALVDTYVRALTMAPLERRVRMRRLRRTVRRHDVHQWVRASLLSLGADQVSLVGRSAG